MICGSADVIDQQHAAYVDEYIPGKTTTVFGNQIFGWLIAEPPMIQEALGTSAAKMTVMGRVLVSFVNRSVITRRYSLCRCVVINFPMMSMNVDVTFLVAGKSWRRSTLFLK